MTKIQMKLVLALLFVSVACGTATVGWAQKATQNPSVAELLAMIHSTEEPERAKAVEQLRSNPAYLQSPNVRAALLDLLDRENHELDSQLIEAQKKGYPDEGDNAVWAEYYGDLLGTVDSFADWNDPRQACILVYAGSSDDSAFAAEVADHAKVTIPCLLKRAESVVSINRAATIPVLVQALGKAKGTLDPTTVQSARRIVLGALQDPDEGVRGFVVHALGKFGSEDMIAPLRKVSESDPSPEVQGHSIRKSAVEAIAAIEKRTAASSATTPQQ
jgi:hypothetical protein